MLAHAPALSALLNPTINSYKRFGPDTLAPWLIDWGLDNRSAMVRIPPERGPGARMEVRLGDATANPYLADRRRRRGRLPGHRGQDRAAGPARGLRLRPGPGADAAACGSATRSTRWRPTASSPTCSASYFVSSFLAYKRNEIERFERYVTDWEFREYAYHL